MQYPNILVASIDRELGEVINRVFHHRCRVTQTASGLDTVITAMETLPHVAFVSRQLEDISGFEVLKALRMHLPQVPVVFLTEEPDEHAVKAFRVGAKDVISQDFSEKSISDALERLRLSGYFHFRKFAAGASARGDAAQLPAEKLWGWWSGWRERLTAAFRDAGQTMAQFLPSPHKFQPTHNNTRPHSTKRRSLFRKSTSSHSKKENPCLQAYYFGSFRISVNGTGIDHFACHKGKEILAYLLLMPNHSAFRDELMEKFWPDCSPEQARNSLNVAVHKIRKLLSKNAPGIKFIEFKDDRYYIHPNIEIQSDIQKFLAHHKAARQMELRGEQESMLQEYRAATEVYTGDFMEEDLYEEWTMEYREQYREMYMQTLERLSHFYCMNGKPLTAITLAERILRNDGTRESAHRRLMFCFWRLNQRDRAIKQYQKCVEFLAKELNVQPSETTRKLFEMIKSDQYDPQKTREYLESKELSNF